MVKLIFKKYFQNSTLKKDFRKKKSKFSEYYQEKQLVMSETTQETTTAYFLCSTSSSSPLISCLVVTSTSPLWQTGGTAGEALTANSEFKQDKPLETLFKAEFCLRTRKSGSPGLTFPHTWCHVASLPSRRLLCHGSGRVSTRSASDV